MKVRKTIRNILIGKSNYLESRFEYKTALLRGYMSLISLAVGLLYSVIDYFNELSSGYTFYLSIILLAIVTIVLNRKKQYTSASILFLLTLNTIIFLFVLDGISLTGIYMFFICACLSALALFGRKQIRYAFLFSILSLSLALFAYWSGDEPRHIAHVSDDYIRIAFTTNLISSLLTCTLIVYFLIDTNHRSEEDLLTTAAELVKSRERNEMVIEAAKAGIYEWRIDSDNIYVSPTWKNLLGYNEAELNNFSLEFYLSIVHPDETDKVKLFIMEHFHSQRPYSIEVRLRTKQGQYLWFNDKGYTKFDKNNKPVVTVGSLININEQKLAEEKIMEQNALLAKANTELDRFVYSVSHDLRAPLSSILGLTNVYTLTKNQEEKESIIKLISDRANTLDAFIREILDYSRNSRRTLKLQEINIRKIIDEVIEELNFMKGFERLSITIKIDPELEVISDHDRLKVILNNLVGNAVKYSDYGKNSFIRISAHSEAEQWIISVEDNGIGIKPEHHERIFDMFYQAHDHSQGSGLGLYIVKETVERMGGEIRMTSVYGLGTTFSLVMPTRVAVPEPQEFETPS